MQLLANVSGTDDGCWLWCGPALAGTDIWEMHQDMKVLTLDRCHYAFEIIFKAPIKKPRNAYKSKHKLNLSYLI